MATDENLDEATLFQQAVKDARPLNFEPIHTPKTRPKPIAKHFLRDEKQALSDSLSDDYIPAHDVESGEELLYLREGQSLRLAQPRARA